LLCDFGLAAQLVGRTGFCIHPRAVVRTIPKVGGTKSVNLARLRELAPTHVIVNIDENEKPTVDAIARFVPHVIVTHPLTPRDNIALYHLFGAIFRRGAEAAALADRFEQAWNESWHRTHALPREKVLYLIWRKPWMTVARTTYISATLAAVGWDTLPEVATERYPAIALETVLAADVTRLLLSTEPYRFRERDVPELVHIVPPHVTVSLIDGEMTSWYGSRAIHGLRYLAQFRQRLASV
ncbi:MAG TPA: helical backbone metal receptor, partial [Burkholderiales bacterium]|nr:helical backbone metal receptor [Burkholderiales bacterium]